MTSPTHCISAAGPRANVWRRAGGRAPSRAPLLPTGLWGRGCRHPAVCESQSPLVGVRAHRMCDKGGVVWGCTCSLSLNLSILWEPCECQHPQLLILLGRPCRLGGADVAARAGGGGASIRHVWGQLRCGLCSPAERVPTRRAGGVWLLGKVQCVRTPYAQRCSRKRNTRNKRGALHTRPTLAAVAQTPDPLRRATFCPQASSCSLEGRTQRGEDGFNHRSERGRIGPTPASRGGADESQEPRSQPHDPWQPAWGGQCGREKNLGGGWVGVGGEVVEEEQNQTARTGGHRVLALRARAAAAVACQPHRRRLVDKLPRASGGSPDFSSHARRPGVWRPAHIYVALPEQARWLARDWSRG